MPTNAPIVNFNSKDKHIRIVSDEVPKCFAFAVEGVRRKTPSSIIKMRQI